MCRRLVSGLLAIVAFMPAAANAEQIAFSVSYLEEELTFIRDREGFDHFTIDGTKPDLRTAGAPALPMRVATVVLPADQTVSAIRVTIDRRHVLDGTYRPSPAPDDDGTRTPRDEYYESRDAPYPDQTAERVEEVMVLGGVRILRLFISPLLWHPKAESIELLESISVQITTEPMRTVTPARRPDAGFAVGANTRDWMRSHAENGADVDRWYPLHQPRYPDERETKSSGYQQQPFGDSPTQWPSRQSLSVEMVIVASEIMSDGSSTTGILDAMGEYADWRDRIAQTEVRSLQDIIEHYPGIDPAHSIKSFFADAWQNWGTDWFLLAGDVENVPTRLIGEDSSSNPLALRRDAPNEQYFVWVDESWNLDGDQWYGESGDTIFVGATQLGSIGRLPCRTGEEAQTIVDKLKSYQSPSGSIPSSYYESMLGAAGPTREYKPPQPSQPPNENSGYEIVESAISKLGAGWSPTRLYGKIPSELRSCSTSQTQEECYGPLRTYVNSLGGDAWDNNDLFDYLDSGFHLVLHVEHSFWDRLGEPSMSRPYPDDGQCDLNVAFKTACMGWLDSLWKNTVEPLTSDEVARLTNGPLYSVICSSGSFTNAFDTNSISEEFMRSADGGAVAYIGKPATSGGTYGDIFGNLLRAAANDGLSLGEAHTYAILQDVQGLPVTALKLPILGDPGMIVWGKDGPQDLQITGFPSTIAPGFASVEVTVKDGSSVPVPEARTVLIQDGSIYATTVSDENGVARFKHAAIASSEDVRVYAHKPGYRVAADTASVQGSGALVYDAHEVFDGVYGDGDGVLDAGEKASVRVRFRNVGTTAVTPTNLRVLPAPRATIGLSINDQYRPGSVYLGAGSAHPASVADSFVVPVSWQGARIEGEPTSFVNEERFHLWRRDSDGQYVLASHSPSASADTAFTGWIRLSGGVTLGSTLLDGSDQVGVNGDLIEFQFLGDGTSDQITFQAEAQDWLQLTPPSPAFYSSVAAGDTVSVLVTVEATSEIPGQELPMTASAKSGTTWWYSDFGLTVERPDVELWALQILPGEEAGYDTAIVIVPTIANLGMGQADSVSFELDVLTGGCAILDGVASCGTFPGGTRRTLSDSLIIGVPTIAALDTLTFEVTATLWHLGRPLPLDVAIGSGEGGGYTPIPPVTNLITHSFGNELELTWDPVTWTYESVVYEPECYLVFLARDTGGIRYPPVARVDADLATRARISADENGAPLPDAAGASDSIRVAVVAVGQGHIMGPIWVSGLRS